MKVLINAAINGHGIETISPIFLKELLYHKGKYIYFYKGFTLITEDDAYNVLSYKPMYRYIFVRIKKIGETISKKDSGFMTIGQLFTIEDIKRNDKDLIKLAEKYNHTINTHFSNFKIIEIPDDVDFFIFENVEGCEYVREKSRTWHYDRYLNKGKLIN